MSVKVAVYRDSIRKDGSLYPRVIHQQIMSFEEFVNYTVKTSGGRHLAISTAANQLAGALSDLLAMGNVIKTPFGTFALGVHKNDGSVTEGSVSLRIDASCLCVSFRPAVELSKSLLTFAVETVETPAPRTPLIREVQNIDCPAMGHSGNIGQILHIGGLRLSFDKAETDTGVFFVGTETDFTYRAKTYSRIGTSNIDFRIPDLPPGQYYLEVRARYGEGTPIRSGSCEQLFLVV